MSDKFITDLLNKGSNRGDSFVTNLLGEPGQTRKDKGKSK